MKSRNPLSVISLFSGAGGLDYGLEAAGLETKVCLEMDKTCCETLRSNRAWNVIENKIENVSSQEILETANLGVREAFLLVGGPPCQPFSKSGYWKNGDSLRLSDPRANTLEEYMRVLEETLPQNFIIENVFGLAYKGKDEGLNYLSDRLKSINIKYKTNYSFSWKVLNSAHYGVPQIRERVFIVGNIDGKNFLFPEQQFYPYEETLNTQLESYRTSWDAIGDLDSSFDSPEESSVGGKWGDLLPSIPEGKNYLWHTERGEGTHLFKWRSRYWSFLLKLSKSMPSWTIQAQPGSAIGPFHWKNRKLSMREMARLQTFPDDVIIYGGNTNIQKQIGNAVPSLLAEVIGREIASQFNGKIYSKPPSLLPERKDYTPSPEKIFPVPNKYIQLITA